MKLRILVDNGSQTELSVVDNIILIPTVGCTVTTEEGTFEIGEVGIDYVKNEVIAWTSVGMYDADMVEQ